PPCQATDLHGRPVTRGPDPTGPLAALAFKVVHDPHAGQLTYVRVYSGTLRTGESVLNSVRGGSERVQRLLRMHANKREQIKSLRAGDLAAVTGWQETATGDTACDAAAPVLLEKMAFPVPTMQVAIYPVDRMNREKLAAALGRLSREDPSVGVTVRSETGETLVSGMGELHLEILVDRLKREFRIDATIGRPRVAYRETIRHEASGEGKYMHHSMGKAQYAHVKLRLAAAPRGAGVSFGATPTCGIPDEYIPAVDRGARALLEKGVLAGFPLIDVKVELEGGSHNDVDSTVIAFQIAAALATFEAAQRAVPCLLEPILLVEAETPEEFTGTVVSDLSQRRGRVTLVERRGPAEVVKAEVPVSTMFGYASDLRSLTQGRASFVAGFCRYSEVPSSDVAGLIAQLGSDAQEDRCSRAAS
ncbi:MAG TPA: EF-Tu/IF-2/RF-3 family GTPase, partial [Polyangiaceae bacterium]|nr:EF-Tu/IF-2/RF-3 family GTPase [Polyangiaceae bacterium]